MNDIPLSVLLGTLALLLTLSAFFSGSETAMMTLNRYRLKHLVRNSHRGALKTHELLKKPERLMGLILLGNNIVNILAAVLTTLIAIRLGGNQLIPLAITLLTLVLLIFCEVTPKTFGALRPEWVAFFSAWLYGPLLKLFYPLVWLINASSRGLLWLIRINPKKPQNPAEIYNREELKNMLADAGDLLPARYQSMLLAMIDLESAQVEDVMTQRKEIVGIDFEEDTDAIIGQLRKARHHWLPVYKKHIDRVIGFLNTRDLLGPVLEQNFEKHLISDYLLKPFFIPAGTSIHKQIQIFKAEKIQIGLVVDEYGDVQGLVTLGDLLQQFAGELVSEDSGIKQQKDGSYLVDASVTVRELNRVTHWNLPTEGPKTLNGLIIDYMETIPEAGTSITLHQHNLEIIECDENTVKLVRFYPET